jgi:hypothetical protein
MRGLMIPAKYLYTALLAAIPFTFGPTPDNAQNAQPLRFPGTTVLSDAEECVYEVSWTLFKLGTVRVKTFPDLHAEAYIDSYDGVPFVNLHSVTTCLMDSSLYCRESRLLEKKENQWWGLEYRSDPRNKTIQVSEIYQNDLAAAPTSRTPTETIALRDSLYIDGLAIGVFPRRFVKGSETITVPTILYGKMGTTEYNFTREIVEQDINALDKPVRTVEVSGYTDAHGVFGLSGKYTAWFSDDSVGVPIKAKVKVLLGNVTLELVQWHRKGWNPPTL